MRMTVQTDDKTPTMLVAHDDQSLVFDLANFNKNHLSGSNDVVEHINAYWATMPVYKQELIFGIYTQIRNVFEEVYETSPLCIALMPLVKQLYEQHDLEEMERWMVYHTSIKIPAKFDETYIHSDERPFSREKTYTRPDYTKLVVLTLSLRVMVPVWGEFICRTKNETGTNFKEYYAYTLLAKTKVVESAAVEKLRIYIESNLQAEKSMASVIVGGVGSEDYVSWLLSSLIVKRLAVGDVRGQEINTNLVVTVHNELSNKNNGGGGSNFGEPILSKIFEGDSGDDQAVSRIENFKIKATHSIGDISAIEHYMRDPIKVAKRLYPKINIPLLREFLSAGKALQSEQLWPCQVSLAQWVLAPVVSPRGIYHLDKISVIRALAITQTYLWQMGHKKLAVLITAIASDGGAVLQQTGTGSSARINREQMEELQKLYPYNRVSIKRKNTIPPNPAVVAIDRIADNFGMRDWIITIPDTYAEEMTGSQLHRKYPCPHEIKIMLAALAIECAKAT